MAKVSPVLVTGILLLVFCVGATSLAEAGPDRAVSEPVLKIDAPTRAQVGKPIKIKVAVEGASDIGGYEADLLFNAGAAQFSSPYGQEGNLGGSGRGVEPLGPVELARGGVSIGAFSCPVSDCVKSGGGTAGARAAKRGVGGSVKLATLSVVPTRAGILEFELDAAKVVNAAGDPVGADLRGGKFAVRVGPKAGGAVHAAPKGASVATKSGPSGPKREGPFDLTGDGAVTHADVMEAAVDWTALRETGAACADDAAGTGRDVDHDGCVDIADLQTIAANYDTGGTDDLRSASAAVDTAAAATFTVDSTADAADANPGNGACATAQGDCTLRAALEEANLNRGPDTVAFDIPGTGVQTINIGSTLPKLNDKTGPTTIDGYTQPGSSPNTAERASNAEIEVQITTPTKHAANIYGLTVTSPGNTIRGLSVFGIRRNVWLFGADALNNTVSGSFIGTSAAGDYFATAYNAQGEGVAIQGGASFNDVGVATTEGRNVVSGNARRGISIFPTDTDSNRVVNNIVGLGPGGDTRVSNWKIGIDLNIDAANNRIGGTGSYERNVVSGSGKLGTDRGQGIELSHGPAVTGNQVVGNYFGTDLAGGSGPSYARMPGGAVNFEDRTGPNNVVEENVIGNSRVGVKIRSAPDQQVRNNRIGISLDGSPIPNEDQGVQIDSYAGGGPSSTGSRIGPGNVITNSGLAGLSVADAPNDRNTITRNSIFGNVGLGIDLEPLGAVTPNDAGDADGGANQQLNFPVIRQAGPQTVSGTACRGCTVEVFVADGGASAYGEGKTFAGSTTANADGTFNVAVSGVASGDFVTSTATNAAGNTSEFSLNEEAVS